MAFQRSEGKKRQENNTTVKQKRATVQMTSFVDRFAGRGAGESKSIAGAFRGRGFLAARTHGHKADHARRGASADAERQRIY
jgi:hypothetical protein